MIALLRRFSAGYVRDLLLGPLCKLVEVVFDLCVPLVIARMVDAGVSSGDVPAVLRCGAALAVMAAAGMGFTLLCQKMAARASQGIGTELRSALFSHVNEFSCAELDRFGTPSLVTRIINDVNQVQLAVALAMRQLVRWPLLAVGSMAAALAIDLRLGVIVLVATPLVGVVFWLVMAKCVPYFKRIQQALDRLALVVREGLSGARPIRANLREGSERERFRTAADEQADLAVAAGRLSSLLNPATFLIMDLAVCAILWAGGAQVDAGALTQGEVLAFVNYMTQTLLSIVYVANLVVVFTKAGASSARIAEVLDCEPAIVDGEGVNAGACADLTPSSLSAPVSAASGVPAVPDAPAVEFRDVSFSYPGARASAIKNVSFRLLPGQTLGIIGGTGAGKSTLVSLLPRLYDVSEGAAEVLGADVRDWSLRDLRGSIGFVPQRATLMSGTVRSNLLWRKPDATDEELMDALRVAQAEEFVAALPEGLDAPVEAAGGNFSGGQRQRLTIARALVGAPAILVLDDSASALDFKTDAALRRALHGVSRARLRSAGSVPLTTVIVSQRISAVRDADLILVLSHGETAGLGTHGQLLEKCEIYREISASQEGAGEEAR